MDRKQECRLRMSLVTPVLDPQRQFTAAWVCSLGGWPGVPVLLGSCVSLWFVTCITVVQRLRLLLPQICEGEDTCALFPHML